MRIFSGLTIALASTSFSSALSIPSEVTDISVRDYAPELINAPVEAAHDLFKRKGGGGKGGGSTSSGGSSSSGSSSSGSRTGSSSGGSSVGSSGIRPSYGGGRFYGGGSTTAYRAGGRSPRGISPLLIASPFLLFPGLWLAGAWAYPYHNPYTFRNTSATNSSNPNGVNQTKQVECLCADHQDCGCDDNSDPTYLNSIVGNGSYAALNKSLVNVVDANGTSKIVVNGTLPNGTSTANTTSGAGAMVIEWSGYWIMAGTVLFAVWGL